MLQFYEPARDYGTPAKSGAQSVSLLIDGQSVSVPAGTSVMRAAFEAGVKVPRLCATDSLEAFGSCRVCLVEIEGMKGYPASCTTPVQPGMVVRTQTDSLARLRRNVMELYISDHPLDCLTCPANGDCELQDTAAELGLREVRYGFAGANHLGAAKDTSNPYFTFDASRCIVCSRCVRACEETQGTFALTIQGRGFDSVVSAGQGEAFMASECVSCGACVKGRFAFGYATHRDRVTRPMLRDSIDEPWRVVSWEEAISHTARRFREIQQRHGRNSIGAISSSRCTNEEVYLVQKMVRAGFGNNNIDTCARVCHSPTGYGLKTTLGESAGTQAFASVAHSDVVLVMGANPTEAHPVFASRLKRRLRQGARLIVIDPRAIELVDAPHIRADYHLAVRPGANVAVLNAMAHVIATEGLQDEAFIAARCDHAQFARWLEFIRDPRQAPEALEAATAVPAQQLREAARLYATGGNAAIYYGLGVTEHSQGSTAVMGIANLAMLTGNIGREGVGVNPLRGQNNVQGSCDMGSFPHELPGYRHLSDAATRGLFEREWGVTLDPEPGMRIPNMFDAAIDGEFRGLYCQGEDVAQSDPNTQHIQAALAALDCLVVQDLFLNETAKFAHVFLPGASFLEKNGTFTNAERRISPVRRVMPPLAGKEDWEVTQDLANALGCPMHYSHPAQIMDEIARLTPSFHSVSYARLDELGSLQWPCDERAPEGTPTMHVDQFVRGKGFFALTEYVPTQERANRRFPLLLTTGRILSQYNVGAQTRRTANSNWHPEDILEIHPHDAQERGVAEGDWVGIQSRVGNTVLRARVSERVRPGVVYTTFHHPLSGANVITTDNSDWATNCPEYKVTAVQVSRVTEPSAWQARQQMFDRRQQQLLDTATPG